MKYLGPPQSNSIAAVTYSRNQYGQYTRARVQPDETSTVRRAASRSNWAAAVGGWAAISDDQRAAWDAWGERLNLSGQAAYVQVAMQSIPLTGALLVTDPPPLPQWNWIATGVDWATGDMEVSWIGSATATVVDVTAPMPGTVRYLPGRNFHWVRWAVIFAGATSPHGLSGGYNGVFGVPVSGQVIGWRFRAWSGADTNPGTGGLFGPAQQFRMLVP